MEKDCLQCNKRFTKPPTRSVRDFLERAKFCSKECYGISMRGKCPEKLLSFHKTRRGKPAYNRGKDVTLVCKECEGHFTVFEWRARQNPQFCSHSCASQYKDFGKTTEDKRIRASEVYKAWRTLVFARDNYTCQHCAVRGGKLHADHIKPFAFYPELRFEITNGRTLCVPCHQKTDTYGGRARNYKKTLWANAV